MGDTMTPDDKRYYDEKFDHVEKLLAQHEELDKLRHSSELTARELAYKDMNRRLEEMNQFRAQISSERTEFVPRREHDLLAERIKSLEISRGEGNGRAAAYASIGAFVAIAAGVVMHFWR
jgi:hypothetical protein